MYAVKDVRTVRDIAKQPTSFSLWFRRRETRFVGAVVFSLLHCSSRTEERWTDHTSIIASHTIIRRKWKVTIPCKHGVPFAFL